MHVIDTDRIGVESGQKGCLSSVIHHRAIVGEEVSMHSVLASLEHLT